MSKGRPLKSEPAGESSARDKDASQTLARGLKVLSIVADASKPVTIGEVAASMSLSRSVVQRLIATLEAEGMIERHPSEGGFQLSIKLWALGCAAIRGLDLATVAKPVLLELAAATQESIKLSVLSKDQVVTLDCVMSARTVRAYVPIGGHLPAISSATGRAILAYVASDSLDRILPPMAREGASLEAVVEDLANVRKKGFSLNSGEIDADTSAIAAPIFDSHGLPIASVGVVLPTIRLPRSSVASLGRMVVAAADRISARLGYVPSAPAKPLKRA